MSMLNPRIQSIGRIPKEGTFRFMFHCLCQSRCLMNGRSYLLPLLCVVAGLLSTHRDAAAADDDEKVFRSLYAKAASRVEVFYRTLAIRSVERQLASEGTTVVETIDYAANQDSMRIVATDHLRDNSLSVLTITPELSFRLNKSGKHTEWSLRDVRHSPSELWNESFRLMAPLAVAPFTCMETRIVDWIADPNFKISEISESFEQSRRLVTVEWQCQFKSPQSDEIIDRAGEFTFLPEDSWVLKETAVGLVGNTARHRTVIEYEAKRQESFPIVRQLRSWIDTPERKDFVRLIEAENVSVQPAEPREFRLSAFGIPDRTEISHFQGWTLLLIGTIGISLALLLKRLTTSKHK